MADVNVCEGEFEHLRRLKEADEKAEGRRELMWKVLLCVFLIELILFEFSYFIYCMKEIISQIAH